MSGDWAVLAPLAAVWALAVILPGPNFLIILWMGATRGRHAALATQLNRLASGPIRSATACSLSRSSP